MFWMRKKVIPVFMIALLVLAETELSCVSAHESAQGFIVKPYLLDVTTDAATVAFHLGAPMPAKIRVFHGATSRDFHSQKPAASHFITIDGLDSSTAYYYQVICGDRTVETPEMDPAYQIRTAGKPGESFSFVVYGDTRPGDTGSDRNHRNIVEEMLFHEPVFALILGDMVDNGDRPEQWEHFFEVGSQLFSRTAAYPVMGDNDYENGKGVFADYFPKLEKGYYRFEWAGVQFFGMRAWDTRGKQKREAIDAGSDQIKWLKSELSRPEVGQAPFRIVFLHDPVFISRGRSSEILRRIWAPVFEQNNVDVVFASWHLYERSHHKGVTYIISGGAGAEIIWMAPNPDYPSHAEAARHHFCRVDINSNIMDIRAIAPDGTVLDQFTLTPKQNTANDAESLSRLARRMQKEIRVNDINGLPQLNLYLFSYDCSYCRRLLQRELPRFAHNHNIMLKVIYFDLSNQGAYELFLNAGAEFGRQDADMPAIFVGRSVIGGQSEIESRLDKELSLFSKNSNDYVGKSIVPFQQAVDTKMMEENAFQELTLWLVLGAGLLDGINPCAFTTIIFLVSYLALFGATRRQVIYTGVMFTLGVFLAYLFAGLLFYHFLSSLFRSQPLFYAVHVILLILVIVLGAVSFVDFVRCYRGNKGEVLLKLPDTLRKGIEERVRIFAGNQLAMIGAPFILGIIIAGMELSCTGQVYLPIVTMISEPAHRVRALSYLLTYNLAFIIPLVIVFVLAVFGITSNRMVKQGRYVTIVKFAHAVFFMIMAFVILYNLGWI
jgi:cytochrome c biogenesis protein CcdA